ncbi:MAG TPA: nucleotidyl transferase AbiEii/AbiGii toxin family protein [Pyrinomonadaceae bacterium]|nr:nucleotidyl transferase AbiEii/AbiGii toxin family protein [Pyrinomonadaceae bacterium]
MIELIDEFRSLIAALKEHQIDYALCGGMAMAVHDRPRMTIDIDLLIQAESLERVMAIASVLGYKIRGKDLSFANGAVEIRRISKVDPESGDLLSLDLLLVTPQIRMSWDSRVTSEWEGGTLSVVSRAGLIALKQLRGSGQDLDDIKALEEGERDAQG